MANSVDKLKELLFEPESAAIARLQSRIDQIAERAGTNERFRASVAEVLDGALRDAEVARHEQVASAIAPLIVKTVKTEIRNSTDDLVEALYPATARMVKAYVASAIKDLTDEINRRLEANPVMLRLSALASGRSPAELAIAQSQRLRVQQVFLIRRGTGELLARWSHDGGRSNQDEVMGGVLSAINEFATEAFKSDGTALRRIDLGDGLVYLRASPLYLLAARCSGTAPASAEAIFDEEFLKLVNSQNAALAQAASQGGKPAAGEPLLEALATALETRLDAMQRKAGGVRPLTLLAWLIGVPLAAWLAWSVYVAIHMGAVERTARQTVGSISAMKGYPYDVVVADGGNSLTVSGLAPSQAVTRDLLDRLHAVLPTVTIVDHLSPVPVVDPDVAPVLAALKEDQKAFEERVQQGIAQQMRARAAGSMARAGKLLAAAEPGADPAEQAELDRLVGEAGAIAANLPQLAGQLDEAAVIARIEAFTATIRQLALSPGAVGGKSGTAGAAAAVPPPSLVESAGKAFSAAENFVDVRAMRRRFDVEAERLRAEIAAIPRPAPDPRAELERFARSHAIFFTETAAYKDEAAANRILEELARLMAADASIVRIVGYTDDQGTPARNQVVSKSRTDAVIAALVARGVPSNRLVALGRTGAERMVNPSRGVGSPNRRVEFEVGFVNEVP